ncbi:EAL domain-containing protein [Alteromonas sp. AMM-1]|uniref:EAL domain-containing protein n=1 Tax=Alteromonas sp. AMM-1 TaxID=3394233 RepID=UPI0039A5C77D
MVNILDKLRRFSDLVGKTSGQNYFDLVVLALSDILDCNFVFIGKLDKHHTYAETLSLAANGKLAENFTYSLANTPCEDVSKDNICFHTSDVCAKFPKDTMLVDMGIESYFGMPLHDSQSRVFGILVALNFSTNTNNEELKILFEIASHRISAEIERRKKEETLHLFSSMFTSSAEAILVANKELEIIEVNDSFCDMFGLSRNDIVGKNPRVFSSGLHNREFYATFWAKIQQTGQWQGEITNRHANGRLLKQWVSVNQIKVGHSEVCRYTALYMDLTRLKTVEERNLYLLNTDPLSKLASKAALTERMQSSQTKWLLMVAIDGLRYLNEAYGFEVCDQLIRATGSLIQLLVHADLCAGVGPGKYAILFEDEVQLNSVASKLRSFFAVNQVTTDDISIYVSLSFSGSYGTTDLLRLASAALRESRELGKPSCVIYSDSEESQKVTRQHKYAEANNLLHRALNQHAVEPYFQGIRNNKTGEITHFEVLARINDNGVIIRPVGFLEAAQVSGLLPALSRAVISRAFDVMANHTYTFSINITEYDLNAQYLQAFLLGLCTQYRIKPERVVLEVLESISSSRKNTHIEQLKSLKQSGFKLAIDDFGAEYSNFERILDLEIDILKIDAKYIKCIDVDTKSYEIVKAIVFFCRNSGILSVAEFVNSPTIQQCVEELGINYSQGYLFSRPHPFENNNSDSDHTSLY